MNKKQYVIIFILSFISASVAGNFSEKNTRKVIERLYEFVTGKPMVYDISQSDEKGIPYLIEGTIGKQRNPMTICNKALLYHDQWIHGDSGKSVLFLNCADWLADDTMDQGNFSVLKYNYNWPFYNMIAPWRSGLANGVSLQVFARAHALTKKEKYLAVADRVLKSFYVEVSNGGVGYKSESQGWWFEEFADEGGYVSRVLNGHMFALLGIHEYFTYTHDSAASYLFKQGLLALKSNLHRYDKGAGHSWYDMRGTPANNKYHSIHIDLLERLFTITGDPFYRSYADKWKTYRPPLLTTRLVTPPVKRIDIAIWLFNFAIVFALILTTFYLVYRKRTPG